MLGASCGNVAVLWSLVTGQKAAVLTRHSDAVQSIRFAPADRFAVTGGNDAKVMLWDIDSGRTLRQWKFDAPVTSVRFSPIGPWLAATSFDGKLRVWNWQTGATRFENVAGRDGATSVDFSGNGALIATGGLLGDVKLSQADSGHEDFILANAGCDGDNCRALVAFDITSERIAVASGDKIWLHDLDFASVRREAIALLVKQRPNVKEDCRRLLQSDSCPGF